MAKLTDLTEVTTLADGDLAMAVDVSNTSMDATGTNSKVTLANVYAYIKAKTDLIYAATLGANDNYVTDAQLVVIGNTSGTNTGDNATNSQYSGLAASKLDASAYDDATSAETNTGTSTAKYVSPDGLAGSYAGTKSVSVLVYDGATDVATGDGKAYITIPDALNGMNLIRANATVVTAGTTNATTVMIHNKTDAQDMLSGAISIASGGTVGTAGTVNTTYDDVATNDVLRIDVDTISTTAPKGLMVVLEFRLP